MSSATTLSEELTPLPAGGGVTKPEPLYMPPAAPMPASPSAAPAVAGVYPLKPQILIAAPVTSVTPPPVAPSSGAVPIEVPQPSTAPGTTAVLHSIGPVLEQAPAAAAVVSTAPAAAAAAAPVSETERIGVAIALVLLGILLLIFLLERDR